MLVFSGLGHFSFQSKTTCLDDDNVPSSSTLYTPHRCAQLKFDMRKLIIFLFILLVISSCKSQNRKTNPNSKFDLFVSNFKTIDLPYVIENEKQFPYYMKYDEETTIHYRDTIYKFIDSTYFKFLYDDKIKFSNIKFRFGNLIFINKEILALFYFRDSLDSEGDLDNIWIFVNTYKLNGELIDKLTLAGYYFDVEYQFCNIDKELIFITNNFTFPPDSSNFDAFKARQKQINSRILENGKFIKNQVLDTIKYFKYDYNGKYIEYHLE